MKSKNTPFLLSLLLFSLLLISCFDSYEQHKRLFDLQFLSKQEASVFTKSMAQTAKDYKLFQCVIEELKQTESTLAITIKKTKNIAGFIPPKSNKPPLIVFEDTTAISNNNVLMEELFHAYQYYFYKKRHIHPFDAPYFGSSNIEYEAKLFKTIARLNENEAFSETPSQAGLTLFTLSLADSLGDIAVKEFSPSQKTEYFKLLTHFATHWQERDRKEQKKTVYSGKIDRRLCPLALLYLLRNRQP